MRNADIDDMGIKTGGRILADLRYADDKAFTVGITPAQEEYCTE